MEKENYEWAELWSVWEEVAEVTWEAVDELCSPGGKVHSLREKMSKRRRGSVRNLTLSCPRLFDSGKT